MFNIPKQITQGDTVEWSEILNNYNTATDTLKCFIRGASSLDLTGVANGNQWDFYIDANQSALLTPGKYKTQFKIFEFSGENKTLGATELLVCPSFESLTEIEVRSADEIELEAVTQAIAKHSNGIKEYWIGDRKMEYRDLNELYQRQRELRQRIAIASGRIKPGGKNVGVSFSS